MTFDPAHAQSQPEEVTCNPRLSKFVNINKISYISGLLKNYLSLDAETLHVTAADNFTPLQNVPPP